MCNVINAINLRLRIANYVQLSNSHLIVIRQSYPK